MSKLNIIIVTYNSKEVIGRCLDKIISPDFNIIVVDNASTDGTAEFISQNYHTVKLMISPHNIGYGRAANLGFRHADTRFVLLLNPDILTTSDSIERLLAHAAKCPLAAIYAPQTRSEKRSLNYEAESVNWVVGAAMLFDMEKMKHIGFFDEKIFLFYEETDLCKRTRNHGYEIVVFNDIFMEHLVGKSSAPSDATTKLKYWHMGWSLAYFNRKHEQNAHFILKSATNFLKYLAKFIMYSLKMNKAKTLKYKSLLTGSIAYLYNIPAFDKNGNPQGIKLPTQKSGN